MNSLIQPYFVMSTSKYYKSVMNQQGISHFYSFTRESLNPQQTLAVPDGCIDIVFSCDTNAPHAEVCGSVLQPTLVLNDDATQFFGVRFYPGNGYKYKDVKIEEIINHTYSFTDLFDAHEMCERIFTSNDFSEQVSIFTNHYNHFLHKANIDINPMNLKQFMLNRIMASKGQIRVGDLAQATGYSQRYVNKKFIEFFGIRPKVFCKIIRFQHVLNQLNQNNKIPTKKSLIKIANEAGYYDQAHMYKDFNEFSNHSPGRYMELLQQNDYINRLIVVEN